MEHSLRCSPAVELPPLPALLPSPMLGQCISCAACPGRAFSFSFFTCLSKPWLWLLSEGRGGSCERPPPGHSEQQAELEQLPVSKPEVCCCRSLALAAPGFVRQEHSGLEVWVLSAAWS